MKVTGIIAEYNPFHKGHAYHIEKAKELTGADYCIVVMSGDYVQRGEPAIVDKYCRAKMALLSGADLVIELPVCYAAASAEGFASGAISLLNGLGCVDSVCFGSESGDIRLLSSYADVLAEEPAYYRDLLKMFLKAGDSFPLARSKALSDYFSYARDILPCAAEDRAFSEAVDPLSSPNNSLGIEYVKALRLSGSTIRPYTIRRESAGYHDLSMEETFASASAIRDALAGYTGRKPDCTDSSATNGYTANFTKNNLNEILSQIPESSSSPFVEYLEEMPIADICDYSEIIHFLLLTKTVDELCEISDFSRDLAERMKNLLPSYTDAKTFADLVKTKAFTHTRIKRCLLHLLLNLRQDEQKRLKEANYPVYACPLGFRKDAGPLLSAIKEHASVPFLSRLAGGRSLIEGFDQPIFVKEQLVKMFDIDRNAAALYDSMTSKKTGKPASSEYSRKMIVI